MYDRLIYFFFDRKTIKEALGPKRCIYYIYLSFFIRRGIQSLTKIRKLKYIRERRETDRERERRRSFFSFPILSRKRRRKRRRGKRSLLVSDNIGWRAMDGRRGRLPATYTKGYTDIQHKIARFDPFDLGTRDIAVRCVFDMFYIHPF